MLSALARGAILHFANASQLNEVNMKFILMIVLVIISFSANADTYDPSTNLLTIPEITVDGITYTEVVVTVGRVVSIGSKFDIEDPDNRNCQGSITRFSNSLDFDFIANPSDGQISAEITGQTNDSSFFTFNLMFIQNGKSTETTKFSLSPGVLFSGDDGFDGGVIPAGITKTGTLSRFPSWLDLSEPFVVFYSGEEFTC